MNLCFKLTNNVSWTAVWSYGSGLRAGVEATQRGRCLAMAGTSQDGVIDDNMVCREQHRIDEKELRRLLNNMDEGTQKKFEIKKEYIYIF